MSVDVLKSCDSPVREASVANEGWSSSLLERAVRAIPHDARFLVYPGGRNAWLAAGDLVTNDLLHGRTFVGFADDSDLAGRSDVRSLAEALSIWKPTHVLLCAKRPSVEERLADKVRALAPGVRVVFPRRYVVDALAPEGRSPSRVRTLVDVKSVTIVMCKTCNIRCSFCYQTDFTERMDPAIFNEKLRAVYPHVHTISLVGGEVTAFRHALPFAEEVARKYPKASLDMTTNAVLFDERWADVFCRTGGGVYNSVVAATPETYKKVAGQDRHAQAMENVRRTVAMRNDCNAPLVIQISMVVIPDTQHEISALVELGAELGVDAVTIGVDALSLHLLDRELIESQVRKLVDAPPIPVNWDRLEMLYPGLIPATSVVEPCSRDRDCVYVEVNGDVFVCCHSHLRIGSLVEHDIETIWSGREAYTVERDVSSGQCATCPHDCIYRPATAISPATITQ